MNPGNSQTLTCSWPSPTFCLPPVGGADGEEGLPAVAVVPGPDEVVRGEPVGLNGVATPWRAPESTRGAR